jgi:hypothetical protein
METDHPSTGFVTLSYLIDAEIARLSGVADAPVSIAVPSAVFDRLVSEARAETLTPPRPREVLHELRIGLVTWLRA